MNKQIKERRIPVLFDAMVSLRKQNRVSISEMAGRIEVGRVMLGRYERGVSDISLRLADKYAEELGYELRLMKK
jgi:transcriptional regulator with XRE-family HTH domain